MQPIDLRRGDVITSRKHKGPLQVAWGGSALGYYVCRKIKCSGHPGAVEVIVRQADIFTKRLRLF